MLHSSRQNVNFNILSLLLKTTMKKAGVNRKQHCTMKCISSVLKFHEDCLQYLRRTQSGSLGCFVCVSTGTPEVLS